MSVSNATVNYTIHLQCLIRYVLYAHTHTHQWSPQEKEDTHTHQWSPQEKEELRGCLLILILLFPKSAVTV